MQAPAEARSARLRLLLRPLSGAAATVYFDDVSFQETAAPSGGSAPAASEGAAGGTGGPRSPGVTSTRKEVARRRAGPSALANVREPRVEETPAAAAGGRRPLWPVLLALGVPAAGLALTTAHAWRARLAGGNKRHL